jgi:hypothetical protein
MLRRQKPELRGAQEWPTAQGRPSPRGPRSGRPCLAAPTPRHARPRHCSDLRPDRTSSLTAALPRQAHLTAPVPPRHCASGGPRRLPPHASSRPRPPPPPPEPRLALTALPTPRRRLAMRPQQCPLSVRRRGEGVCPPTLPPPAAGRRHHHHRRRQQRPEGPRIWSFLLGFGCPPYLIMKYNEDSGKADLKWLE